MSTPSKTVQPTRPRWVVATEIAKEGIWIETDADEPDEICQMSSATVGRKAARANASLIVRAVNSHALLEALATELAAWNGPSYSASRALRGFQEAARAAIANQDPHSP